MAQRNWTFGFALSLLIHLCMLIAYLLTGPYDVGQLVFPPRRPGGVDIRLDPTPQTIGTIGSHLRAAAAPRIAASKGTPVPVAEERAIPTPESSPGLSGPGEGEVPGNDVGEGVPGGPISVEETEPLPYTPIEKFPEVIVSSVPVYPPIALRAGLEGKVWVNIWVDSKGRVRKAVVVNSTNDIFNESAAESASKFVFIPAYMNSGPVAVWVVVPFTFRLH